MARNVFQQAVMDLNCAYTGLSEKDYESLGGGRHIRILAGGRDAERESDAKGKIVLQMHGVGQVEGSDLADAVSKMKARISGAPASPAGKRE